MSLLSTSSVAFPTELEEDLRALNPWWAGRPAPRTPPFRRWLFDRLRRLLLAGLTPAVLVTLADDVTVYDPRIIPIPLSSFLWLR